MKYLLVIMFVLFVSLAASCTHPSEAQRVLQEQGYTNIETGGYAWFSCGEGDHYQTKFTATSPSGHRVIGVVCSGLLLKSTTIRFR
jgi:hypothetical protein